jgi:hypothetical protein
MVFFVYRVEILSERPLLDVARVYFRGSILEERKKRKEEAASSSFSKKREERQETR